tara:strand:- start:415 stop:645 length:231 start_codon:yes stop_codon:yes gene_type:complete
MKILLSSYPELVKQFHKTKNGHLKPSQVSKGSNKRVWFICDFGHEYETKIQYRTGKGSGCPRCAGKKINDNVNLKS